MVFLKENALFSDVLRGDWVCVFFLKVRPSRGVMNIAYFFVVMFVCSLKYFSGETCIVFGVQMLSQSFVVV